MNGRRAPLPIPARHEAFWARAERARPGRLDRSRFLEAFAFGDSEAMAAELAALVLDGAKRATAGLVASFEHDGRPLPVPGDLSIVTLWGGEPLAIIETTAADVVPFADVGEAFARTEGEGDATLASWRRNHRAYFRDECRRIGRTFDERMPVVCECFDVVFAVPAWQCTVHDDRGPAGAADVVDQGLGDANDAAAPLHEVQPLSAYAHDAEGRVIGGAVGRSWGGACELQQLWVDPAWRGQGIGAALVRRFEARALERGCTLAYLDTFSFQAPRLYLALGYEAVLENAAFPHGIVRHTMHKALRR